MMKVTPLSRRERILIVVILVLALVSRFLMLGDRAMSHDESIHTKFSWNLYAGLGFQHNPMMHGPLLFELTALTYHLFGVSDFTSRVVVALAGVALVISPTLFRRWIGSAGALATAFLLLISPSITYYSRYIRHDVLLMLSAVLLLWTVLAYLDSGRDRWLWLMAAAFSVMYATKEASYFYTAIFGGLLFIPFAYRVLTAPWRTRGQLRVFLGALVLALVLGAGFAISLSGASTSNVPLDAAGDSQATTIGVPPWGRVFAVGAMLAAIAALLVAANGIGRERLKRSRLFDVLMSLGTLTLPLGSAFLIKFATGVDMNVVYEAVRTGNFASVPGPTVVSLAVVVVATLALSAVLGLWWDPRRWPRLALIHYAIFLVLYTTVFTWGFGAISGLVGGLAYWLAQQGVKRGSQPWYYYGLVGPLYEYLIVLLSVVGGVAAVARAGRRPTAMVEDDGEALWSLDTRRLLPVFLFAWAIISWVAYTYAGEKMPWLFVHIALPSAFVAGWWIGQWAERAAWTWMRRSVTWLMAGSVIFGLASLVAAVQGLTQAQAAFQSGIPSAGPSLPQLDALGLLLGGLVGLVAAVWVAARGAGRVSPQSMQRLATAAILALLAVLTIRTTVNFAFINDGLATEFLVYAHGTPDIKEALGRVEEVSWAVTGTADQVRVAYGEDGSWPLTWYMVFYPNNYFYSTTPDAEQLLDCPVVIAGSQQYDAVEGILGRDYVAYDYNYLWWPIQDYFGLTAQRVLGALSDPDMRSALWDIAWQRDYTRYASLKNPENPFNLHRWPLRKEFRLYVRRDTAYAIWPHTRPPGAARYVEPVATEPPDPYASGGRALPVEMTRAFPGAVVRGIAAEADGTLYVGDTHNHRVWRVSAEGEVSGVGAFGSEPGQFNEPWGVGIDQAGNLYVADTWNHRIQKFDAELRFVRSWGGLVQTNELGVPDNEGKFYGPRGVAVSSSGELYVADTGNKRVQVFDLDGAFLREFGGWGSGAGQLDEPVGIGISATGLIAVADTWNQRVQIFDAQGNALRAWHMPGWDATNPDVKPFLAWDADHLYVADPHRQRVLAFTDQGTYEWSLSAAAGAGLSFPLGIVSMDDMLLVSDVHAGQVVGYQLP